MRFGLAAVILGSIGWLIDPPISQAQTSGWIYGHAHYGAQQVRSAQTFQNTGTTFPEMTKANLSVFSGDLAFEYFLPKWAFSTGLGYTLSVFKYSNVVPGASTRKSVARTLDTSSYYLSFVPRYRAGEYFSIGPRLQIYPSSKAFHSESSSGTGSYLAYTGFDASFDFENTPNSLFRFGFTGMMDINENKRTTIFMGAYISLGLNIFRTEASTIKEKFSERPLIKAIQDKSSQPTRMTNIIAVPNIQSQDSHSILITIPTDGFLYDRTLGGTRVLSRESRRYLNDLATELASLSKLWNQIELSGTQMNTSKPLTKGESPLDWANDIKTAMSSMDALADRITTKASRSVTTRNQVELTLRASKTKNTVVLSNALRALHKRSGYE